MGENTNPTDPADDDVEDVETETNDEGTPKEKKPHPEQGVGRQGKGQGATKGFPHRGGPDTDEPTTPT